MDTDEGYDPAVWSQMANELGLQSLIIPEEYGGQGFTFVELTVVLEEMGRALLCAVLLAPACSPPPRCCTPATTPPRRSTSPASPPARRSPRSPSPSRTASGTRAASRPPPPRTATATSSTARRCSCSTVRPTWSSSRPRPTPGVAVRRRPDASGLTRTNLATMDQTRKQAKIELAGAPPRSSAPTAPAGTTSSGCSTSPRWRWPPSRSAAPRRCSRWPCSTPRTACSSAARSARSRPSSTSAPTCCSRSSRPSRPPTTPPGAPPSSTTSCPRSPASPRPTAPRRTSTPPPRTSRSTAASASPGSTRPPLLQAGQERRAALRRSHVPPRAARAAHRHCPTPDQSGRLREGAATVPARWGRGVRSRRGVGALMAIAGLRGSGGVRPRARDIPAIFDLDEAAPGGARRLPSRGHARPCGLRRRRRS